MKKLLLLSTIGVCAFAQADAQIPFPVHIATDWTTQTVLMPKSPLMYQNIFIGGLDTVQTTNTYGFAGGGVPAKQWHDYIAFVKDSAAVGDLGWVVVNHEMTTKNDYVGDGGGMTTFKLKRTAGDKLEVVKQTLPDGRTGKFFNVDFVNTVGETGMNCGGITKNGRVWTAEEWMQSSNSAIYAGGTGFRDTTDFVIGTTTPAGFPAFNGKTLKRYQNLNWLVEVNPKTAKAVRKQYNWGRAGWEGGVIMDDNKTVYMFEDGSPGILGKFVASTPGDFTVGQMYVYKHDALTKWLAIENNLDTLVNLNTVAIRRGATMFNRLEWGAVSGGKIYICETGRDAFAYNSGIALKGVISPSLVDGYKIRYKIVNGVDFPGTDAAAADSVRNGRFFDYYGRVIEFDPATDAVRSYIEGGPYTATATSKDLPYYPSKHLSNPDGIDFLTVKGKTYMMIEEDLNGSSYNRMPNGFTQTVCELYLLDMSIANPTISDLQRLSACAPGAEITGAVQIDNKTILVNSQHPNSSNIAPYNNSLTYAISGFDGSDKLSIFEQAEVKTNAFSVYPNPAARELHLSKVMDVAIYSVTGARIKVLRNTQTVDVTDMASGTYFIRSAEGETVKFIVE
ncbi:MAG: alkaline phosphatase PhoX [Bacteroidota bacterium]